MEQIKYFGTASLLLIVHNKFELVSMCPSIVHQCKLTPYRLTAGIALAFFADGWTLVSATLGIPDIERVCRRVVTAAALTPPSFAGCFGRWSHVMGWNTSYGAQCLPQPGHWKPVVGTTLAALSSYMDLERLSRELLSVRESIACSLRMCFIRYH